MKISKKDDILFVELFKEDIETNTVLQEKITSSTLHNFCLWLAEQDELADAVLELIDNNPSNQIALRIITDIANYKSLIITLKGKENEAIEWIKENPNEALNAYQENLKEQEVLKKEILEETFKDLDEVFDSLLEENMISQEFYGSVKNLMQIELNKDIDLQSQIKTTDNKTLYKVSYHRLTPLIELAARGVTGKVYKKDDEYILLTTNPLFKDNVVNVGEEEYLEKFYIMDMHKLRTFV